MSEAYSGGCACGAIRYEIPAEPMVMHDCQCRDCQRRSGTGHGSYLTFPGIGVATSRNPRICHQICCQELTAQPIVIENSREANTSRIRALGTYCR